MGEMNVREDDLLVDSLVGMKEFEEKYEAAVDKLYDALVAAWAWFQANGHRLPYNEMSTALSELTNGWEEYEKYSKADKVPQTFYVHATTNEGMRFNFNVHALLSSDVPAEVYSDFHHWKKVEENVHKKQKEIQDAKKLRGDPHKQ
jgi:hypothetical protein